MAGELVPTPPDRRKGALKNGNDIGPGPKLGQKYFKPALRRYLQKHPEFVDKIAENMLKAAAGEKTVKVLVGENVVDLDIPFRDQLKAAEVARDTLGEKQIPVVEAQEGQRLQVVYVEDISDLEDYPLPPRVVEVLQQKPRTIEDELEEG